MLIGAACQRVLSAGTTIALELKPGFDNMRASFDILGLRSESSQYLALSSSDRYNDFRDWMSSLLWTVGSHLIEGIN